MVHRQAGEGTMLSRHTPAKQPFASEPVKRFPSGAAAAAAQLSQPPVVAAEASPRARVPPQVRPNRNTGLCPFPSKTPRRVRLSPRDLASGEARV